MTERDGFFMLWIATQDKKSLMNVKEVTVDGKKIEGVINRDSMDHWSKVLGKYESNERALEVLDQIFTKIEENSGISVTYTMPKK
jgi:Tfp pilus assembly ATPase PilU